MKLPLNRFWSIAALVLVAVLLTLLFSLFWLNSRLSPDETRLLVRLLHRHLELFIGTAFLLCIIIAWAVDIVYRSYIHPIRQITEEMSLIDAANPAHRITARGAAEIRNLCRQINENADQSEAVENSIEDKIHIARAASEQEKNILAAIVAELSEGVIICNPDGQILLCNNRAKEMLTGSEVHNETEELLSQRRARLVGLGRSVFSLIDEHLIHHALDEINQKLKSNKPDAIVYFVISGVKDSLLRVETIPILNTRSQFSGYILIFDDITRQLEIDERLRLLFGSITRGIRGSLSAIRAAVEAMIAYPEMEPTKQATFQEIIHEESVKISNILDTDVSTYAGQYYTQWPLVQTEPPGFLNMLQMKAREKLGIDLHLEAIPEDIEDTWFKADSYSFSLTLLFLLGQLETLTVCREFRCRIGKSGKLLGLDFIWSGPPLKIETLREWGRKEIRVGTEGFPLTLEEVLNYHLADMTSYSSNETENESFLRVFLRYTEESEPEKSRPPAVLPHSRPEFYDFELFHRPGLVPEIETQPLTELVYTVFDTEATGLNPREGDEIISIGAYRLVNCRIINEERFNQLVSTERDIPWASIKIHGIVPEMLAGQPPIEKVLPRFHRFAADTILVAHNAAFDMRLLQMKEAQTGVRFENPVIDTLLLSAVVNPGLEDHSLEAIARRLGVQVTGRHTALGDAYVTAQLFLKLLPLLAKKKIYTLKDALDALEQSYYARLKY